MINEIRDYVSFLQEKGLDNKGSTIAQILKNERLKRNLTLEELSKGICSISYLCKLENYAIRCNQEYVKELFERMDIDYGEVCANDSDTLVDECIKNYFYDRHEEIICAYQKTINVPFSSGKALIKCFYHLVKKEYELFKEEVKALDKIKYTLSGNDSLVYIYIVIEYLINICDYVQALDYLRAVDILEIKPKILYYMFIEANIIVSFNLQNHCRLLQKYHEYEQNTFIGYPIGRKQEMRMIYNATIASEYSEQVFEDIETIDYEQISCDYRFNVLYYQYLIKMNYGDKQELFNDIVNKSYYIDTRFVGLLGYLCYKTNIKANYTILLNVVENVKFNEEDRIHQEFACFILLYASNVRNEELTAYLRTKIIPNLNKEINFLYNEVYQEIFINLLVAESKYKEAFYLVSKLTKKEMMSKLKLLRKPN